MISALLLAGCSPDLTPSYAFDPIWIEPTAEEGGIEGFHTWQIYGPRWPKHYSERHYVCSVLVGISGVETECDAEECTIGWEITASVLESDCAPKSFAEDPFFVSLLRLGLGGEATGPDVPWPGSTSIGWADYGNGWEVHGDAYPDALDTEGTADDPTWNDEQPFSMVPTQSFPL